MTPSRRLEIYEETLKRFLASDNLVTLCDVWYPLLTDAEKQEWTDIHNADRSVHPTSVMLPEFAKALPPWTMPLTQEYVSSRLRVIRKAIKSVKSKMT